MNLTLKARERTGRRIIVGLSLFFGLSTAASAFAEGVYSDAQLKLAGQIGAVMGLVERCGSVAMPSAAILRAMKAEGLRETDMTRETEFKARVVKQAQAMKVMEGVSSKVGTTEVERRKGACANLAEMYGPKGFVRPGLSSPR